MTSAQTYLFFGLFVQEVHDQSCTFILHNGRTEEDHAVGDAKDDEHNLHEVNDQQEELQGTFSSFSAKVILQRTCSNASKYVFPMFLQR